MIKENLVIQFFKKANCPDIPEEFTHDKGRSVYYIHHKTGVKYLPIIKDKELIGYSPSLGFGGGNILLAHGILQGIGMMGFRGSEKAMPLGCMNYDSEQNYNREFDFTFTFSNTKSIDIVINSLSKLKEKMEAYERAEAYELGA